MFLSQIGSDLEGKLRYTLKGPGANEPPYNLFVVDETTGKVRITDLLDREKTDKYNVRTKYKHLHIYMRTHRTVQKH